MAYDVYRIAFNGSPRDHHAVFIDLGGFAGTMIHVTGTIYTSTGMRAQKRVDYKPKEGRLYTGECVKLGTVEEDQLETLWEIAEKTPAPAYQYENGPPTNRYACQEWTRDYVAKAESEGVLKV